jgi:hypothetical protein
MPFVHSIIDRHGHRRHYFRRSGYKRVTLPGAWGSAEFQDAYRGPTSAPNDARIEEALLARGVILFAEPTPGARLAEKR